MIVKYDDKERAVYLDEPLTKEIARTIKYEPPIKCKLPIVQKAVFHRTATVDDETYGVEGYSEWEAENNTWDKVEIDEEEGYDVFPKVVESKEVNADAENETVLVKYEEVFEKVEMNRDKAYAKRKKKPPLPPAEENKETENGETSKETEGIKNDEERKETEKNEEVKDFKGIEIKRDKPYAKRKKKPPLPSTEGNKETEEVENVKEPKETEKNEEVKDFKGIKINRDEPYAKRKKKPSLSTKGTEKNEETENVKEPKEEDKSLSSDAFLSQFKEQVLKPVDEEKKTDSETLPSAKESSLSKAKQSIISKTNEKNRQKEAFRNYQQQKYHEKMNGCVRNVRVQKPIQINDLGRFSAETIDFLNELKEIGEEALTREKWKVTLFAK